MASKRPYREFLYLDIPKVESIISQLDEGLSRDQSSQKSMHNKASAGGSFAQLLNLSGEHGRARSLQETKVLHDYAFNRAANLLHEHGLVKLSTNLSVPFDAASLPFVSIAGDLSIHDHKILQTVASQSAAFRESENSGLFPRDPAGPQDVMPDPEIFAISAKTLFQLWGDVVLSTVVDSHGNTFKMLMRRPFLREDSLAFVMRYGFRPIGKWQSLGLITAVPTVEQSEEAQRDIDNPPETVGGTMMQTILPMIELATKLVFSLSGVQVPDIAFDPIAVYREVAPLS